MPISANIALIASTSAALRSNLSSQNQHQLLFEQYSIVLHSFFQANISKYRLDKIPTVISYLFATIMLSLIGRYFLKETNLITIIVISHSDIKTTVRSIAAIGVFLFNSRRYAS